MKKLLLGSVATGALVAAGSANAADLGTRPVYKAAPVVAPVPVFSWTGCYVGAHGGWGWGKTDIHEAAAFNQSSATFGATHFTSIHHGARKTATIDTSGAIFGGQVGCDYQFSSNFVIGVQGMFAGTGMSGDTKDAFDPTSDIDILHVKKDWIADITVRLGFTGWLPRTMFYVKGGPAWVRDRFDFRNADCDSNFGGGVLGCTSRGLFSLTQTGWTIGGGVEYAIAPNWSLFAEYDYYDFGTKNVLHRSKSGSCDLFGSDSDFDSSTFAGTTSCNVSASFDSRQRVEAVKVGVSYRFDIGKGKAPIQARY